MPYREIFEKILKEFQKANDKYPPFRSAHEGYGVLLEEIAEVFDHVRKKPQERNMEELEGELVQVAAMAVKFIWWCRNYEDGVKNEG